MRVVLKAALAIAAAAALAGGLWWSLAAHRPAETSPTTGIRLDRPLPDVPLVDEDGKPVTLADFRGKVVVVSPTLTLCHEVCPLTVGAFNAMQAAVRRAGLGGRVVFAAISVDPWRDSPARLRAFSHYADVRFALLTGNERSLRRFWRALGVGFFRTPQGKHPGLDWWTHRPETFDVAHTDGLFFLDGRGHLRIAMLGVPSLRGELAPTLRSLLSEEGLADLRHPQVPWTLREALSNLSLLAGRSIPAPGER